MLKHVPLLEKAREIYRMPRSRARFEHYLRTIVNTRGDDLELVPLVAMNPMAKDHVLALVEQFIEMDAEQIAAHAMNDAARRVPDLDGDYRIGLVVVDDLLGGWTNRADVDFGLRFGSRRLKDRASAKSLHRQNWLTAVLWSSEPASTETVRLAVQTAVYRLAYVQRNGDPQTLREMMAQEGEVLSQAEWNGQTLDVEELAYTREVVAPFLDSEYFPTAVECLFGDVAARTLGFTPRGLSADAGLALAVHDARCAAVS